ncbi:MULTISPECIES: D-ribose pyranase [Paraclostridium]|uniref:D-ribose pyranase n=1 Tax=Paraclostridium bifermentans TaxID=1490 RepID=A0AA44DLB1_PARBF|nr:MULTISPECIES: D-ribose pyranase [Paraclostridium]MDV8115287.1 D-ribose pyranase [Bacillus sp. BAU-SS-2023]EQK39048.1 D-ribose pyranase [[Clostridium] bifermentans ATCC 19299] [Paraclostridium bifermentans ATCC 19299]MBN8047552.1 D-ribose pyranase [Paraclostridium bifermentans]MBZ6004345.1 D-ribose pyranase [Paraclostridium bifermentans]MCE9675345.1 D-ribose pyranase [Paraclostridium bifermentans]
MKKSVLINSEISSVISKMGHTDMLTICDSGLPIPKNVERIDLALKHGIPTFLDTLDTVLEELKVEEVIIACEMEEVSTKLYKEIENRFKDIKITKIDHEEFKAVTKDSMAIVRTGEFTPYANIILKSGVVF